MFFFCFFLDKPAVKFTFPGEALPPIFLILKQDKNNRGPKSTIKVNKYKLQDHPSSELEEQRPKNYNKVNKEITVAPFLPAVKQRQKTQYKSVKRYRSTFLPAGTTEAKKAQ